MLENIVLKHVTERVNFIRERSPFQSAPQRWIDGSSMLNKAIFQIHILQLWLFQILVWIGPLA